MTVSTKQKIPGHLKKYIVEQDYNCYTPEDHAVWRYILRQLRSHLSDHGHPSYLEGLKKTGITVDKIPSIAEIDEHLESFGWGAVPVSGFIPPAAFMEFQAIGILPIASDMRTLAHLQYTPAPDIVHEAAGHAPILADPEYANYLREYGDVARHAILNREDLELYEAIRMLSDKKEDPTSNAEQIAEAEKKLYAIATSMGEPSEAALLSRMNWWTAEYGLMGNLSNPRIYGAGLLSSVGEARSCLRPEVKKIPLSIDCINYSYNITEPQPQLFVAESFAHLRSVLQELRSRMAFCRGDQYGLDLAFKARTVNTVQLNSGIQISGQLERYDANENTITFLKFSGPSQLSYCDQELPQQGTSRHSHGFSSPIGYLSGETHCLSSFQERDLTRIGLKRGHRGQLHFGSGIRLEGLLKDLIYKDGKLLLLTWSDCRVIRGDQVLFDPAWGEFDMAVGSSVTSVFGGASDREKFGDTHDFVTPKVPQKDYPLRARQRHSLFARIRALRERMNEDRHTGIGLTEFCDLSRSVLANHNSDWLLAIELLELSYQMALGNEYRSSLLEILKLDNFSSMEERQCIHYGISLARQN